jgi:hypothetical protein
MALGGGSGVASGHKQDLAKLVSSLILGTVFNADIFTTYFTSIVVCTCITDPVSSYDTSIIFKNSKFEDFKNDKYCI